MRVGGNNVYIVTAKEMYVLERIAIEDFGIPAPALMYSAGLEIARHLTATFKKDSRFTVICGYGNNGGDGFVVATALLSKGYSVQVVQLVQEKTMKQDVLRYKNVYLKSGGVLVQLSKAEELKPLLENTDVVVDALLGIGVNGRPKADVASMIETINESVSTIVSIDIPSGLPTDCVNEEILAVQAHKTYVLGAYKMSRFIPITAPFYGETELLDFGLPSSVYNNFEKRCISTREAVHTSLPKRDAFSHKGSHGKGLIIGGSRYMPGSISMTTEASLRTGAGLIQVATVEAAIPIIATVCREAMYVPLDGEDTITGENGLELADVDVLAIGPGMGRSIKTGIFFKDILRKVETPIVIDADGLYHLQNELPELKSKRQSIVLTPHPKEMANLLNISVKSLLADPFTMTANFCKEYGVFCLLKGKYTIISSPDGRQKVNLTGNPGLAKGGTGDVLTGIVLGLMLQNETDLFQTLCNACYIHGKSADLLTEQTHAEQDLMATDVISGLGAVYRSFI